MLYAITVSAGLETIAREELSERFADTGHLKIIGRKPQRILFEYTGNPRELLSLRIAENLFLILKQMPKMTRSRSSLAVLSRSLERFNFKATLECCRQIGIKTRKRMPFRVTSRLSGKRNFRRVDLQRVIERALIDRGWYSGSSKSALDVWAEVHGDDGYLSIRLSPNDMAQRPYKQAHIPASLKPTLAYSMVRLSRPHPEDVFLDAMCGAGTLLLERALIKRYRYLIGGDVSTDALDATVSNFGRKHQPCQFFHWDAQSLPLRSNTVDKIVCNLPFGETIGNVPELTSLYRQCLREYERVLNPRGRMVLLTSQSRLLNDELKQRRSLRISQQLTVDVRGMRAWMCVIRPKTK
ncbi:MAG: methyltransferase domain-containing protein [Candidatus Poribacteria bacterium]|nr:methyltransferase domain-containing protein [Candidatus Poribacteria bacterium]